MIDYFFHFPSEAAAIADAQGTKFYTPAQADGTPGSWFGQCVAPGLQVWRPSQDVIGQDAQGNPTVTHTYLTGWYGCISLITQVPALLNHPKLALAIDRDLAAAGHVAIIQNNLGALLQDIVFSPVFAGSNYPFGNFAVIEIRFYNDRPPIVIYTLRGDRTTLYFFTAFRLGGDTRSILPYEACCFA